MNITNESIKRPVAITVLIFAAIVIGVFGFTQLPVNLLPDITYPLVKVYVNWRGATPEEIEDNIAEIIEPKMATVDNLDYLESQCTDGLYTLLVNFDYAADRDIAYQDVTAKMGLVKKKLPADAEEPLIIKADPSQLPVIDLLVVSQKMDLVSLRLWVENELQKYFATVEGTAGTEVTGGLLREVRVIVNPHKMQALGITIDSLLKALRDANIELSAGRITGQAKEFNVRTMGRFTSIDDIKNVILKRDEYGGYLYLRDIAQVVDTHDVQRIITRLNGIEGVKLSIFKQANANTVQVEEHIRQKIQELQNILPSDVKMKIIYNQADYIRAAVTGVRDAAVIAALLVILVTWFFLSGWRRILIVTLSIPLPLLLTFFSMNVLGYSLNILSLGGLVIAITVILDQTVVVLENITRLQEEGVANYVEEGANQVNVALAFATLTFMALFLPFLMVPGLVSLLFHELIITVALSIGFSMLVALTVTPMLANRLLFGFTIVHEVAQKMISGKSAQGHKVPLRDRFMHNLTQWYQVKLQSALKRRFRIISITTIIFIFGVIFLNFVGTEFLPKADDGMITVKVKMPIGTAMQQTFQVVKNIEQEALKIKDVETAFSLAGGKIWGLVTSEVAYEGEVDIQLVPGNKRKITTDGFVEKYGDQLRKAARYPGAKVKVFHTKMKGIRQIGEFDVEVEIRAPKTVAVKDMAVTAQSIINKIKDIKGLTNIDISLDVTKPEYHILVNRDRVSDLGISVNQIATTARMLIDGLIATYYFDSGYYYPVRVVLGEEQFKGKIDIGNIPLLTVGGLPIYISSIGTVERSQGPVEIDRIDQMRLIKVTASVVGQSVGDVNNEIQKRLHDFMLPSGWHISMGAQARMMSENFKSLLIIITLALFFAYVILAIQFESFGVPFLLLIRIPLSLAGISVIMFLTNTPIGVTVLIGVVILSGMELIHGVVLITFIRELEQTESIENAIIRASTLRLRPILMTVFVGIFGLLPLAMGWGEGTELLQPMAIADIGGLIYSLFLTFFFMPVAYYMMQKKKNN